MAYVKSVIANKIQPMGVSLSKQAYMHEGAHSRSVKPQQKYDRHNVWRQSTSSISGVELGTYRNHGQLGFGQCGTHPRGTKD